LDNLSSLTAFVRAAEARSFTSAGQQLGLSSSAIGKSIARLEDRLGVRLFHRTTRNINLTQEGQVFLESCRRIISEIKTVEQEFVQAKGTPRGRLRLSLPLVGSWMMPVFSKFMRLYPEIELDMDFSDHLVDVVGGGYDVVIRSGEVGDSRLMSRTLGAYRLNIVGAPAYFARAGIPTTPEDLAVHACLHYKCAATGKLQRWPVGKAVAGSGLPVTASVSAVEPLVSLVELGHGIACLPEIAVRRPIREGALVSILDDHVEDTDVFRAMWPSSRFMSPKLRVFIDFLAENLFPPGAPSRGRNIQIAAGLASAADGFRSLVPATSKPRNDRSTEIVGLFGSAGR
jgi:DNA-binding transcriptional LysR family regulator